MLHFWHVVKPLSTCSCTFMLRFWYVVKPLSTCSYTFMLSSWHLNQASVNLKPHVLAQLWASESSRCPFKLSFQHCAKPPRSSHKPVATSHGTHPQAPQHKPTVLTPCKVANSVLTPLAQWQHFAVVVGLAMSWGERMIMPVSVCLSLCLCHQVSSMADKF